MHKIKQTKALALPHGWVSHKIGDIAVRVTEKNTTGNENVLTISAEFGLVSQEDYFNRRVASADTSTYYLMHRGDFAYNKSYSAGYPAGVIRRLDAYESGVVSPLYICFRPSSSVHSDFLRHYFSSGILDDDLSWIAKEGVRNHGLLNVSVDEFFSLPIGLPPYPEQRKIAKILDSVDESIRTAERLIAKLKRTSIGHIQRLLAGDPAWESVAVSTVLAGKPKNGYSPKEVADFTGILMLGLGCLTGEGFEPRQLKNAPANDSRLRGAILADGDLLMSRANTRELVGLAGRFRDVGVPCTYPDLMMRLTPSEMIYPEFLELVLRSHDARRQIMAAAVGTSSSMVKISSPIVQAIVIPLPPRDAQRRILEQTSSLREVLRCHTHEVTKLLALKRGLVSDLLTGRVRVNAEEGVAA